MTCLRCNAEMQEGGVYEGRVVGDSISYTNVLWSMEKPPAGTTEKNPEIIEWRRNSTPLMARRCATCGSIEIFALQ
jgi:hypothetical protein